MTIMTFHTTHPTLGDINTLGKVQNIEIKYLSSISHHRLTFPPMMSKCILHLDFQSFTSELGRALIYKYVCKQRKDKSILKFSMSCVFLATIHDSVEQILKENLLNMHHIKT
jgi:hypothetical protein